MIELPEAGASGLGEGCWVSNLETYPNGDSNVKGLTPLELRYG